MIVTTEHAVDRLQELERLFEHARCHAAHDALLLGEIFEQARTILDELAAARLEHASDPEREAIVEAAQRAQRSHSALSHAIGIEVARVSRELSRLSRGSAATATYAAASRLPSPGVFSRSR